MRTQHRGTPEAPPLPESAFLISDDEEEGPSRSFLGHDMHFLERTARLPGPELERAMRLYRHSAIVKRVLAEKLPQQRDRVAIAISDAAPAAHVIVCADGVFVTCLSASMHTGRVPVLPYEQFLDAMDAVDAVHEQAATRRRQLALLGASHLTEALHRGPGYIDQEMVRVIELLPQTYVVPVLFAAQHTMTRYLRLSKTSFKIECLLKRDRHDTECLALRQRLFRHLSLAEATVKMCLYLFGAMDSETITTWLGTFVRHSSPILPEIAFALARHQRGGELMLPYLQDAKPGSALFRLRLHAMLHHIVYHPHHIPLVFSALKENAAYLAMAQALELPAAPELPTLTPEQAQQLSAVMLENLPPLQPYPEDSHGLADVGWIDDVGLHKGPVSALFPPRAQLKEVGRRWQEYLRSPPPIEASHVRTVVRTAPRVGRNEPCPCRSGRKHKHCCLDRASPCPPAP